MKIIKYIFAVIIGLLFTPLYATVTTVYTSICIITEEPTDGDYNLTFLNSKLTVHQRNTGAELPKGATLNMTDKASKLHCFPQLKIQNAVELSPTQARIRIENKQGSSEIPFTLRGGGLDTRCISFYEDIRDPKKPALLINNENSFQITMKDSDLGKKIIVQSITQASGIGLYFVNFAPL
jgi:hypothetical protein